MTNRPRPACADGTTIDPRWTSNKRADIAYAVAACQTCTARICQPILAEMLTDITMRGNIEGVWDGVYRSPRTTGRHRDDERGAA